MATTTPAAAFALPTVHADLIEHSVRLADRERNLDDASISEAQVVAIKSSTVKIRGWATLDENVQACRADRSGSAERFRNEVLIPYCDTVTAKAERVIRRIKGLPEPVAAAPLVTRVETLRIEAQPIRVEAQPLRVSALETFVPAARPTRSASPIDAAALSLNSSEFELQVNGSGKSASRSQPARPVMPSLSSLPSHSLPQVQSGSERDSAPPLPSVPCPSVSALRTSVAQTVSLHTAKILVVHADANKIDSTMFGVEKDKAVLAPTDGSSYEDALNRALQAGAKAQLVIIDAFKLPGRAAKTQTQISDAIQKAMAANAAGSARVIIAIPALTVASALGKVAEKIQGAVVVNKAGEIAR